MVAEQKCLLADFGRAANAAVVLHSIALLRLAIKWQQMNGKMAVYWFICSSHLLNMACSMLRLSVLQYMS